MPLHIAAPLLESRPLSILSGRTVWLKMEALQPTGSFKIRGIGLACEEQARQGAKRFISSSGGNAGLAAAYAGRHLNVPVTVVVPRSTSEHAKALIGRESAEVIVHGTSWSDANELAQSMVGAQDAFVHPFDHPTLWRGHAGMIDEVAQAGMKPDAVLVSVGGGGLFCGVIEGLRRNGLSDVPVIAVETDGADSFAQSVAAGHRVTLPGITSIATSLGARQVCEQAFRWVNQHPVETAVVSDREAVIACRRFLDDHRLLVEPACGAALSLLYERHTVLDRYNELLLIVCGGATATLEQIEAWKRQLAG